MRVTFTGTRKGMSLSQKDAVVQLLEEFPPTIACHGCCHGADSHFHLLVVVNTMAKIIGYPSNPEQEGWAVDSMRNDDEIRPIEPPLQRNRTMVTYADLVIACPGTHAEILRSGTWATIRYAKKVGKRIAIVYPNGAIEWWFKGALIGKMPPS